MNTRMTDPQQARYKDKRDKANRPGSNGEWAKRPKENTVDSLTEDET